MLIGINTNGRSVTESAARESTKNMEMHKTFEPLHPANLSENAIKMIGGDWMLITAGSRESFNTMTASWGGFGVLWNKPVAFIFVRPVRYTYLFTEEMETFTLSFFSDKYRKALNYCGSHSGRDVDKIAETGLTPLSMPEGSLAFAEAKIIMECKKLYFQDLQPLNFLDRDIDRHYPGQDYHRMYVGEIIHCFRRQEP